METNQTPRTTLSNDDAQHMMVLLEMHVTTAMLERLGRMLRTWSNDPSHERITRNEYKRLAEYAETRLSERNR